MDTLLGVSEYPSHAPHLSLNVGATTGFSLVHFSQQWKLLLFWSEANTVLGDWHVLFFAMYIVFVSHVTSSCRNVNLQFINRF